MFTIYLRTKLCPVQMVHQLLPQTERKIEISYTCRAVALPKKKQKKKQKQKKNVFLDGLIPYIIQNSGSYVD
jgi:hypothetical protein